MDRETEIGNAAVQITGGGNVPNVGLLDWLRDSIRNEDREGFGSALKLIRNLLSELEASLPSSFDQRRDRNDPKKR